MATIKSSTSEPPTAQSNDRAYAMTPGRALSAVLGVTGVAKIDHKRRPASSSTCLLAFVPKRFEAMPGRSCA
jgi:hypothetical protein